MPAVMENLNVKIDADEKRQFTEIARSLGTTPSNAVRMFVRAFNDYSGFPFSVARPYRMSAATQAAYEELDAEIKAGTARRYGSVAELRADLEL